MTIYSYSEVINPYDFSFPLLLLDNDILPSRNTIISETVTNAKSGALIEKLEHAVKSKSNYPLQIIESTISGIRATQTFTYY